MLDLAPLPVMLQSSIEVRRQGVLSGTGPPVFVPGCMCCWCLTPLSTRRASRCDSSRAEACTQARLEQASHRPGKRALTKLGWQDVRRQLYSDKDDREIFTTIQDQLRRIDKQLEDGRAALQHLEMALINVACDDPGAAIGGHLILPLLQERLDGKALDFADRRAVEAEEDIIRMEVTLHNGALRISAH